MNPKNTRSGDPLSDDAAPILPMGGSADEQKAIYEAALKKQMFKKAAMPQPPQPVVVVDVKIPFWSLVKWMVKVTLASIPAALLAALIVYGVILGLGVILNAVFRH